MLPDRFASASAAAGTSISDTSRPSRSAVHLNVSGSIRNNTAGSDPTAIRSDLTCLNDHPGKVRLRHFAAFTGIAYPSSGPIVYTNGCPRKFACTRRDPSIPILSVTLFRGVNSAGLSRLPFAAIPNRSTKAGLSSPYTAGSASEFSANARIGVSFTAFTSASTRSPAASLHLPPANGRHDHLSPTRRNSTDSPSTNSHTNVCTSPVSIDASFVSRKLSGFSAIARSSAISCATRNAHRLNRLRQITVPFPPGSGKNASASGRLPAGPVSVTSSNGFSAVAPPVLSAAGSHPATCAPHIIDTKSFTAA